MKLAAEFKSRGLEVLLVDVQENAQLVKRVVTERGYPNRVLLDATGDVSARAWGVFGTPTVYLIDREGRLVARGVGPRDWEQPAARSVLEALVGAPARR